MAENPSVKKYYDYAQQQVDEQAIADKFNAATAAQFNVQREQNRQAENQFYNQMYNTQRTAMDTIRQSNAAAVSSGASRGVQAANELSALLGLQEQSVSSATELAQANRQTAQEETAAVLENMLNAYQQAATERQQLVQQGIEAASVDVQQQANVVQQESVADSKLNTVISAAQNGFDDLMVAATGQGYDLATYSPDNVSLLNQALNGITKDEGAFKKKNWNGSKTGKAKAEDYIADVNQLCIAFGIDPNTPEIQSAMKDLKDFASKDANWTGGNPFQSGEQYTRGNQADKTNARVNKLYEAVRVAYAAKANPTTKE